jgi:hypothetical protein
VADETNPPEHRGRRSTTADTAAARWAQQHPDQDIELDPPSRVPEPEDEVPNRHSASAEAAALRWHERHPEDG